MKRTRIITVVAISVTAVVGLWVPLLPAPPDPVYHGTRLSAYLEALANDDVEMGIRANMGMIMNPCPLTLQGVYPPSSQHDAVARLIPEFGTNALPLLVDWIKARDSVFDRTVNWLGRYQSLVVFHRLTASEKQAAAVAALGYLGPSANRAVPSLVALLRNPDSERAAIFALSMIHPLWTPDLLALTNAINDPDARVEMEAMAVMASLGPDATGAVPALVARLQRGGLGGRAGAAVALAEIGAAPQQVVPLIARNLRLTTSVAGPGYPSSTELNLWALVQLGGVSEGGFLMSSNLVNDPDPRVRDTAKLARQRVLSNNRNRLNPADN
ncbi:MAG: HEAT repeat domain-containing protein [Limisphaerales bacterium]